MGRPNGISIQSDWLSQTNLCSRMIPLNPHMIGFFHLMAGVHQGIGKGTVVGKQQQSLRIHIQSSHRIHPCSAVCHQLCRIGSSLFIGKGSHIAPGLIQEDIHRHIGGGERLPIHQNFILLGIRRHSQLCWDAVHNNAALEDHLLRLSAGAVAAVGDEFVQALALRFVALQENPSFDAFFPL